VIGPGLLARLIGEDQVIARRMSQSALAAAAWNASALERPSCRLVDEPEYAMLSAWRRRTRQADSAVGRWSCLATPSYPWPRSPAAIATEVLAPTVC